MCNSNYGSRKLQKADGKKMSSSLLQAASMHRVNGQQTLTNDPNRYYIICDLQSPVT
jgi:hypothetical protein